MTTDGGPIPRFFVDQRCGCIAVRDREQTDPEYPGLHSDTDGVVWYRHGTRGGDGGWEISTFVVDEANVECDRLNAIEANRPVVSDQPKPIPPSEAENARLDGALQTELAITQHLQQAIATYRDKALWKLIVTAYGNAPFGTAHDKIVADARAMQRAVEGGAA